MIPFPLQAAQFGRGGAESDPYWANVVALLHMDGTNGSTTFTDQTGKTWTANGGAQISTAQSKFGGASLLLNGTTDYIETASSSDLNFDSGQFTVESFFRCSVNTTAQQCIASKYQDASTGWTLQVLSGKLIVTLSGDGIDIQGTASLVAGQWYYVALSGQSGAIRLFLDGVQDGSTYTGSTTLTGTSTMRIGRNVGTAYFNGHIDEFRTTKGVARYTANFTPPSAPFPNS